MIDVLDSIEAGESVVEIRGDDDHGGLCEQHGLGSSRQTDSFLLATLEPDVYIVLVEGWGAMEGQYTLAVNCGITDVPTQAPTQAPAQPSPTAYTGYVEREVGNCDGQCYIESLQDCALAAANLGMGDVTPNRDDITGVDVEVSSVFAIGNAYPLGCCRDLEPAHARLQVCTPPILQLLVNLFPHTAKLTLSPPPPAAAAATSHFPPHHTVVSS